MDAPCSGLTNRLPHPSLLASSSRAVLRGGCFANSFCSATVAYMLTNRSGACTPPPSPPSPPPRPPLAVPAPSPPPPRATLPVLCANYTANRTGDLVNNVPTSNDAYCLIYLCSGMVLRAGATSLFSPHRLRLQAKFSQTVGTVTAVLQRLSIVSALFVHATPFCRYDASLGRKLQRRYGHLPRQARRRDCHHQQQQ